MENEVDPWDWSINQVVDALCHSRTLWQDGRPNSALPEPLLFEHNLRENDVNGSTLLNDVTPESLKDDFGIKSLGQRSSVSWAIRQLQNRSEKYAVERPPPTPGFASIQASPGGYPYGFSRQPTPRSSFHNELPTIYSTPPYHDSRPLDKHHDGSTEGGASPTFARPALPERPALVQSPSPAPAASILSGRGDTAADATSGKRNAGEIRFEDETGRKRRKLDPSSTTTITTLSNGRMTGGLTLVSSSASSTIASFATAKTSVPSIANPTASKAKQVELRSKLCGSRPGTSTFLGKDKFSLEKIFFGSTQYDNPLNVEVDMLPLNENGPLPDMAFSYHGLAAQSVYGRQMFVNKKLMTFFSRNSKLEIAVSDQSLAFFPYFSSSPQSQQPRAIIRVKEKCGIIVAIREKPPKPTRNTDNGIEGDTTSLNHDWDFLAHWHRKDDEELPAYGESDDEAESELDSLEKEMEEDKREDSEVKKHLSKEDVADVIDEAITEQIRRWRDKRFPVLVDKALSTWMKGRTTKDRHLLVSYARQAIAQCDDYLTKIKRRIMDDMHSRRKDVLELCEALEETVKRREEEKFKISVWQRSLAPPPPSGKLRTRKKRTTHVLSDAAEHMLDSDEEVIDDGEDENDDRPALAEFVDVDALVPLDLTFVAGSPGSHDEQVPDNEIADEMDMDTEEELELPDPDSGSGSLLRGHGSVTDKTAEQEPEEVSKEEPAHLSTTAASIGPRVRWEVDLTVSSEDEETPPAASGISSQPTQALSQKLRGRSSYPEDDPDADIQEWDWFDLEEEEDRIRIIIKLIRSMPSKPYQLLREHVIEDYGAGRRPKIYDLGESVQAVLRKRLKQNPRFTMAVNAYERAEELLHLYICWLEKSPQFFRKGYDVSSDKFDLVPLEDDMLESALETILGDEALDLGHCLKYIYGAFEKHAHPLGGGIDEDGDSDVIEVNGGEPSQSASNKRRKREVAESQIAVNLRRNVKKSVAAWEDRSRLFLSQHENQSSNLSPADEGIVVNTGKEEHEPEILISAHIAKALKPHQIEGIRFAWRELVGTSSDDSEDTQGALLAHTMGLGKTLQMYVSSLLRLLQ
jgi:hypothetical protein